MIESPALAAPQVARSGELRICVSRTRLIQVLPAMDRHEWESLPDCVKTFIPWDEARVAKIAEFPTDEVLNDSVEYFTRPR